MRGLGRTRLDRVDGRVGEGAHRAGNKPDDHMLIGGQLLQLRLFRERELLELLVCCEIRACAETRSVSTITFVSGKRAGRALVRRLPQRGQRDSAVECAEALFSDDLVDRMPCVPVHWLLKRVRERMVLRLQPDLHHLHWCHDEDRFCGACTKSSCPRHLESASAFRARVRMEKTHPRKCSPRSSSLSAGPRATPCRLRSSRSGLPFSEQCRRGRHRGPCRAREASRA